VADELIDIVDENNNPLGIQKMKFEAFEKGLWHRASHIWIYNPKGEMLLQLRAKSKLVNPDKWDVSVGGHIGAGGEPLTTAVREAGEELGLQVDPKDLEFIKIVKVEDDKNKVRDNEFLYVYLLKFDGNIKILKLQEEEVQKVGFFKLNELEEDLQSKPEKYGHDRSYLLEMIAEVRKRISKR
jgi:isopentenyldiphosphate isomerase